MKPFRRYLAGLLKSVRKPDMFDLLTIAGFAGLVNGIYMWSPELAWVIGGGLLLAAGLAGAVVKARSAE